MATPAVAAYPIGTPGVQWGLKEKTEWRDSRKKHRCYHEHVASKLTNIAGFSTHHYGTLTVENKVEGYPLYALHSNDWDPSKPHLLITGGVHGYETSGVMGAIQFLQTKAVFYSQIFNILVIPCVSPWGFECVERWNSRAVDPNRSFNPHGEIVPGRSFNPEPATQESTALLEHLQGLGVKQWLCHLDLHETTDSDKTEFCPSKRARDGIVLDPTKDGEEVDSIPDGFYLVSDSTNPQTAWHKAMIESVRKVTHIAPTDPDGTLIGETVVQEGVIAIPAPSSLGLCAGTTNAPYATTTEVYPDSPKATPEQCNDAQVACIVGGLDFIIQEQKLKASSSTGQ